MSIVKWKVEELEECTSTLDVARQFDAWTVVRAVRQTGGRGRFNRTWYADEGGLWASYNLPLDLAKGRDPGVLPLVAGVSVLEVLRRYAIEGLRLRWPNDVMVGRSKLVGILVERPRTDMVSVGVGVNVFNEVGHLAERIKDPPARLADLVKECPTPPQLSELIAQSLAAEFGTFTKGGLEALSGKLAAAWGERRQVEVETDDGLHTGRFEGVDGDGSPLLSRTDGSRYTVPGISVLRLRELDTISNERTS